MCESGTLIYNCCGGKKVYIHEVIHMAKSLCQLAKLSKGISDDILHVWMHEPAAKIEEKKN